MGGFGSGGYSGRGKTSERTQVDVRKLHLHRALKPNESLRLEWTGRDSIPRTQELEVVWSACNFGGERPWFVCQACRRRVAILYSGNVYACRHCHDLSYPSQREGKDDRWLRKADSIRTRLGWGPGIACAPGQRPKGMHWKTYARLQAELAVLVARSFAALDAQLSVLQGRIDRANARIAKTTGKGEPLGD